jgi:hypothetical protein
MRSNAAKTTDLTTAVRLLKELPNGRTRQIIEMFIDGKPHHIDEIWDMLDRAEAAFDVDYLYKSRAVGTYMHRANAVLTARTARVIGRVDRGLYKLLQYKL